MVFAATARERGILGSLSGRFPDCDRLYEEPGCQFFLCTGPLIKKGGSAPRALIGDEANHAPNENMEVELFLKGIRTGAALLDRLGR